MNIADLVAEVCAFYGWTVDHVLSMPARRFFSMLRSARKLKAVERMDACDIAAIPSCKPSYYEKLRGTFSAPFQPEIEPMSREQAHQALMNKLGSRARSHSEVNRG